MRWPVDSRCVERNVVDVKRQLRDQQQERPRQQSNTDDVAEPAVGG
jgi:hypothetical protein